MRLLMLMIVVFSSASTHLLTYLLSTRTQSLYIPSYLLQVLSVSVHSLHLLQSIYPSLQLRSVALFDELASLNKPNKALQRVFAHVILQILDEGAIAKYFEQEHVLVHVFEVF